MTLLAAAACSRGDYGRQYLYYVRDGCDCTIFWQCERVRGQIVARRQQCPPCLCFSDDTWVCSDRVPPAPGQVCPTQAPVTEAISRVTDSCYRIGVGAAGPYSQQYKAVSGDPTSYIWVVNGIDIQMQCPPGTAFDFNSLCQCVACQPGQICATENIRVFRMNFDDSSEMQGVYADIGDSLQTVPGGIVGNAELFDGKGNITIPFFKNNEFSEFTLSLWFNRDTSIPSGEEGLVSNGNDLASGCSPATISILSTGTSVSAGVITNLTVASIAHSNSAALGSWHHVVLRYSSANGLLDLFLDGVKQSTAAFGPTLRTKCSLLIGHSVDAADVHHSFIGEMDEIRFYRRALSDADVSRLYLSPGSNP